MTEHGEDNPQSSEEVGNQVDKQRAQMIRTEETLQKVQNMTPKSIYTKNHNQELEGSRLAFSRSSSLFHCPEEMISKGELLDFQGSLPPNSRMKPPDMQEGK